MVNLLSTNGPIKSKILWSLCLGLFFISAGIFYIILGMDFVGLIITYQMRVTNNSIVSDFLSKNMDTFHISTTLFNITNSERFLSGEDQRLKVEEVGPFTYKEIRHNDDFYINEEAQEIHYAPRSEVEFVPEESVGDPEKVMLTVPNLPMIGLTSTVSTYNFWARTVWNLLVTQLQSQPVIRINAYDFLWGYEEPLLTLAHTAIPGFFKFDKIGLLDRLFDKQMPNRLVVSAREEDKFTIKTRNGMPKLPMGSLKSVEGCEICNNFTDAYEGVGYPSPINPDFKINLFRSGLCRLLPMVFDKKVYLENNVEGLLYNLSDSFYSLDPNVTRNRMLDLEDCFYGLPAVLTKVRFLDMDPDIYERIEGMKKPDPAKNSFIIIEPKIATQLQSYFPVQINLRMHDMSYNSVGKPFSNMILPIGYVEINQAKYTKMTSDALYLTYVICPKLILLAQLGLPALGILCITYSIVLYRMHKIDLGRRFSIVLNTQVPLLRVKSLG